MTPDAHQMPKHQQTIQEATEGELFRLLVENVKDYAIFVVDPEGRVRSWNPGAERLLGYSESEIIGQPTAVFFTLEDIQDGVPHRDMGKAVEVGRGKDERWHVRKDGSRFWSVGTITPLWDEGRNLRGFAKIMRDCTSQKLSDTALKDALAYAEDVVETVRESLLILGSDLRVKTANRSFYQTFRVSAAETEGQLVYHLGNRQWDIPLLRKLLEEILPLNRSFDGFEVEHEFGTIGRKVMLLNARHFYREGNHTTLILLAIEDITERRRVEEDRRETETRFTSLVKNIKDHAIITMDPDGRITSGNTEAERILGYSEAEMLGQPSSLIFTPNDVQDGIPGQELRRAKESGRAVGERWHVYKGGRGFWALGIVTPTHDANGKHAGFSKILRDMTEQKLADEKRQRAHKGAKTQVQEKTAELRTANEELQKEIEDHKLAEQQVRQNEERFRLLVEGVKDYAIFMLDPSGNVVSWNAGAEQILGYKAEEIVGRNYSFYFSAEDVASGTPQLELEQAAMEGRLQVEGWRLRKDGSRFWSNGVLTTLHDESGQLRGFGKITRDLTERQGLEALFRSVFDHASDAIITSDSKGNILLLNHAAEKLFGYSAAELVGKNVRNLMPEPYRTNHDTYIADYVRTGQAKILGIGREVKGLRKDGSLFPAWLAVAEFFSNDQRYFLGILRDMTARKLLEEQITTERDFSNTILENLPGVVLLFDRHGRMIRWNKGLERVSGFSASEISSMTALDFIPADEKPLINERIKQAFEEGLAATEANVLTKNGQLKPHLFSEIRLAINNEPCLLAMGLDISDRRRLEEQLHQAQKLEAIGQLAGGVAHDFNNLLTVISGFSEMLLMNLRPDDPSREMIQQVHKAGERATGLTRQLLAFSRKTVLEPKILDLNAIVTDVEKMLQRLIGEDVMLTTVLAPVLRQVKVDPGLIEQVIVNLAVNARDAMPQGGKLTIETGNVDLDQNYAAAHSEVKPGRYVMLAVTDTGCGMTPEVQARLFEPFFTTKEVGKGTGLGLATVYGIVKQSGGSINIYSEPSHGTSFKVYLPAVEKDISTGESLHGGEITAHGTETVLLVEDEDAVRLITRLSLQQFGYTVLEARRGAEAIRLCEQQQGKIHLLVTDVVMPEMGGRQLAERVAQLRPGIKVLYLSGYTDDAVVRHGVLQAEVAFLQKPFAMAALANKVRQVLNP